jgi:hypothetical protein
MHNDELASVPDQEDPILCQIERISYHIERTKLYAQWWMTRALTGEIKSSSLKHGDSTPLSDMEKVKNALVTAHNHIRNLEELTETKISLMKKLIKP